VAAVNSLGQQVPYNCPNCGGVLWEMDSATVPRYRCHTGHSFTLPALLDGQSEKIEETLWIALRMFEERKNLLNSTNNSFAVQRAKETQIHIERIRAILLDPRTWQHSLDRVKKMMSAHPKTKSVRDEEERLENLSRVSKKKASRSKWMLSGSKLQQRQLFRQSLPGSFPRSDSFTRVTPQKPWAGASCPPISVEPSTSGLLAESTPHKKADSHRR